MPYDKGDFTEQGINGAVTALVRLNDKRVVKMALSSDDESSNVDVTGTVYDYLNGETYPLGGSTPTGTITITENGTGIDVAQYRLANVNVSGGGGGGDVPTCEVTLIPSEDTINFSLDNPSYCIDNYALTPPSTVSLQTTLTCLYVYFGVGYVVTMFPATGSILVASDAVNCAWDSDNLGIRVTDGTQPSSITLTGYTPK